MDKLNKWLELLTWDNVGSVCALLVLLAAVVGFIRAVSAQDNNYNLLDMFLPLGSSKMRLNGTWVIGLWTLAVETIHRTSNVTTILGMLLAAFVTDRMMSRKATKPGEKKQEEGDGAK